MAAVQQVSGELSRNRNSLEIEIPESQLQGQAAVSDDSSSANNVEASESSTEDEDYDTQKVDETAVMEGGEGGDVHINGINIEEKNGSTKHVRPQLNGRRMSIPVLLEKTEKKGLYMLRADDVEVRELLKQHDQKQEASPGKPKKKGLRDLVFTRRFTAFDRQNPSASESPFHGFFTLAWLCMAGLLIKIAAQNWKTYGSIFGGNEIVRLMMKRDVVVLGITDGAMCLATIFGLILQLVILRGFLSWNEHGWIIQNAWQTFYLFMVLWWTWYRDWPWTHTIFVVLHALVFVMKQHSYAFYNGYLSEVYRRRQVLSKKLRELETFSPLESPSATTTDFSLDSDIQKARQRRRVSASNVKSAAKENLSKESTEVRSILASMSSGQPLDASQLRACKDILAAEIEALNEELRGKCSVTDNHYPRNLTVFNWAEWTCFPTLVYELEYPRQPSVNWIYVLEKAAATFGCIGIMIVISQAYLYPAVVETVRMKEAGLSMLERAKEFPWIMSDMLFPLLLEQLLTWYVIWECVLNVLAELTRFADRGFYGDWWNSVSWDQYARDWNRPVHNFLLRHVYHSSISAFHLSKTSATFVTFLLSALVHELLMFCLFKKVRGYLFTMQLLQVPLAMFSRTKFMKGRDLLGNVIFWIGLFIGPSLLTSLYLIV